MKTKLKRKLKYLSNENEELSMNSLGDDHNSKLKNNHSDKKETMNWQEWFPNNHWYDSFVLICLERLDVKRRVWYVMNEEHILVDWFLCETRIDELHETQWQK